MSTHLRSSIYAGTHYIIKKLSSCGGLCGRKRRFKRIALLLRLSIFALLRLENMKSYQVVNQTLFCIENINFKFGDIFIILT